MTFITTPQPQDSRPTGRQLQSIESISERLGVSVRHVRRLVNERRIPFIKWGHLLRFDLDEVEQWIDHNRRPTNDGR